MTFPVTVFCSIQSRVGAEILFFHSFWNPKATLPAWARFLQPVEFGRTPIGCVCNLAQFSLDQLKCKSVGAGLVAQFQLLRVALLKVTREGLVCVTSGLQQPEAAKEHKNLLLFSGSTLQMSQLSSSAPWQSQQKRWCHSSYWTFSTPLPTLTAFPLLSA